MSKRRPQLTTLTQAAQAGEDEHVLKAIAVSDGDITTAVKLLDVPHRQLRRKLKRLGVTVPRAKHFDTLEEAVLKAENACIKRAMFACDFRTQPAADLLGIHASELECRLDFMRLNPYYAHEIGHQRGRLLEVAWFHGGRDSRGMADFMGMGIEDLITVLHKDGSRLFIFHPNRSFFYKYDSSSGARLIDDPWPRSNDGQHIKGYRNAVLQIMLDEAQLSLAKSKGDLVIAAFHLNIQPEELKTILVHHGYVVQDETFRRP